MCGFYSMLHNCSCLCREQGQGFLTRVGLAAIEVSRSSIPALGGSRMTTERFQHSCCQDCCGFPNPLEQSLHSLGKQREAALEDLPGQRATFWGEERVCS